MNIVQNKINPHIYINQIKKKKKKLEFRSGNLLVSLSSSLSLKHRKETKQILSWALNLTLSPKKLHFVIAFKMKWR